MARFEGMLQTQGVTDFMHKCHEVIGAFDGVRVVGRRSDPDIPAHRRSVGVVAPGSGFVIHPGVAAEPQVSSADGIVSDLSELEIGYGAPRAQCGFDSVLLGKCQSETVPVLLFGAVVGGEE